jgi:prepilin-type N-terminal cleavage/methylation domain-containing protein
MIVKYIRIFSVNIKKIAKSRSGFTLAEVLITLLIIGVIASIVIPGLIQNSQDAELKTAWKKLYSELSNATKLFITENSGSLANVFQTSEDMVNAYKPKFNCIKECSASDTPGNCWHTGIGFKHMNGIDGGTRYYPGFILNNGGMVIFRLTDANCTQDNINCGWIYVDVNGFKGPNIVGKDIFLADLRANSIIPAGADGDSTGGTALSTCSPTGTGWGCSALYISQ